ncbi:MAG: hypothetical protein LBL49_08920 [Clostridiales Family XIII bacterium]|nr:hypothetical protein [Clostridiales Family XIII bacterium]
MKVKKLPVAVLVLMGVCLCLAACGTKSTANQASALESEGVDTEKTAELVMATQLYVGDSIIEVPQFAAGESSEVLDSVNAKILEFAGDYERFTETGADGEEWLELKCYPFLDDKYIQVVLTRAVYPNYGTYGKIASFCYDYQEDKEYRLEDLADIDGEAISNKEGALIAALGEKEPESKIDGFELSAFTFSHMGNIYFYSVHFEPPEIGDPPENVLYVCNTDGSYEMYNNKILHFGTGENELLNMEPPLYYARGV